MNDLLRAVSFLTRVPVGAVIQDEREIARAVPWFPIVGALVGLAIAGLYAVLLLILPPLVAAVVAISAGVVLTGAFHEDGLGDVVDAFWGGWTPEERLRIMKDPHLGTFGTLAIGASLLLRVAVLSSIETQMAIVLLPSAHALSRTFSIVAMRTYPPAGEGLGASYVRFLSPTQVLVGTVSGITITGLAIGWWVGPAILLCWFGMKVVGFISLRKIGGVTGDVLGAIQQVSENLVLVMGAALITLALPGTTWFV